MLCNLEPTEAHVTFQLQLKQQLRCDIYHICIGVNLNTARFCGTVTFAIANSVIQEKSSEAKDEENQMTAEICSTLLNKVTFIVYSRSKREE